MSFAATPDALASTARLSLVEPDAAKRFPESIDKGAALMVLRGLAAHADKPNLVARDSSQPISAYVTEDALDAGFTFRGA